MLLSSLSIDMVVVVAAAMVVMYSVVAAHVRPGRWGWRLLISEARLGIV
jgi:hypothetical protein